MIYKSTTIDEVIGRVIRNTRIQDSSYISDMGEWIPEAMGLMQTKVELTPTYEDVQVNFHMGKLPCGLKWIRSVEWNGHRIPENNSSRQAGSAKYTATDSALASTSGFTTVPTQITGQSNGVATKLYGYELCGLSSCSVTACNSLPLHSKVWYQIEMDYLQFSVPDALVRIHYVRIPLDQNGFPLIPDEENYKQALYFYVRKMMLGAGYEDKAYTMAQLDIEFEKYAARAMGKIRYPSVDSMDMKVERMTRLVPDVNYFNSFFSGTGAEKYYGNTNIVNYPNI